MSLYAAYIALGLAVGFVAGLLGVGGGLIIVPVLIALFQAFAIATGIEPQLALGTSLASILFTSISSMRAHHRHGAVEWELVRRIAPGIVDGFGRGCRNQGYGSSGTTATGRSWKV